MLRVERRDWSHLRPVTAIIRFAKLKDRQSRYWITCAYTPRSTLPPDRITPTVLPAMASRSCTRAARAEAPAPSARLWVSV